MKRIMDFVDSLSNDFSLFFIRIVWGGMMLLHGIGKLMDLINGNTLFFDDFDPFGIGGLAMLSGAVFAEFVCSIMLIVGLFTRLALIPLITTMFMAFFIFHASDDFVDKEPPLLYLVGFIFLFLTGPGKYSIDKWEKSVQ